MNAPRTASRRASQVLLGSFVALALGTFLWGLFVVNGVRARAVHVDAALRSTAWACLAFTQLEQSWPASEDQLRGASGAWIESRVPSDGPWPGTRLEALAGSQPLDSPPEALALVAVECPGDGSPPRITARGNPSGIGTLEEVNGWLVARGKFLQSPAPGTGTPSSR